MTPADVMQLAIDEAWKYQGLTYPNPAVGAAVTGPRGELLAVAAHQKAGGPHAEVLALKEAYRRLSGDDEILSIELSSDIHDYLSLHHNGIFHDCIIFVTLEPCAHVGKTPSCATLIQTLGLNKVVMAHEDPNVIASGGKGTLEVAGIEVESGLLHKEASELLLPFKRWQQQRFVVFKWAQRLDGTIDGGTVSSVGSRTMVHSIRDCCDLLVIGGNTVRCDRPTLDARMVNGKAPDVLIISHQKTFDQTIPLFSVPGRRVMIADSLEAMSGYNNILIEGGPGMFEWARPVTDLYLCYISPVSGGTIPFTKTAVDLDIVNTRHLGSDVVMWLKEK